MTKNLWKKFEKSNFFQSAKLKIRQWYGREPKFKIDLKLNITTFGDWGVPLEHVHSGDVMYSFGICDDIDFEKEIYKNKNISINAFDPTPYSVDWIKKQDIGHCLQFHPHAVSDRNGHFYLYPLLNKKGRASKKMYSFHTQNKERSDGVKVEALTIDSIMKKLNHKHVDIIKMDIEGAEYGVINNLLESSIRPRIIMMEYHHRFEGINKKETIGSVNALKCAGYLLVYISPAGREMCFLKDDPKA